MTLELRSGALVDPFGRLLQFPCVDVDGQPLRIERLVSHTHPEPTGPSEADFKVLELLDQDESILYEINGLTRVRCFEGGASNTEVSHECSSQRQLRD